MRNRRRQTVRRVAIVTGTRAEYGLLATVMKAMRAQRRPQMRLVVTGMHLLPKFGRTVREIRRDGWPIAACVRMQAGDDRAVDQAVGLARGVAGIARFLLRSNCDTVMVLGDRIEALAGALAAVTTGRTLAHIHGGDVAPGDFDEALRDAITMLANIHFAATRQAARRIIRMGGDPAQVHVVGAPGLDRLRELLAAADRTAIRLSGRPATRSAGSALLSQARVANQTRPTALVVYHAWGRAPAIEQRVMTFILNAVAACGLRRLVLYPNTDRGHTGVLAAIDEHVRRCAPGEVEVVRSLSRDEYLRALIAAKVLIGNSSSGIIEAPFAGTPSVNVGGRQAGRIPGGPTIVHADETATSIRAALREALDLPRRPGRRTPYGDGRAGERIAALLAGRRS